MNDDASKERSAAALARARAARTQGDDEDDPAPLPSWLPAELHDSCQQPLLRSTAPEPRALAFGMLILGCAGVVIGLFFPSAHTEILLGAILALFGLRVLLGST